MQDSKISLVLNTILKRRSCRSFLKDEIRSEHLDCFISALRWAPSAGNRQPWHFYLISNRQIKLKLVHAAYGQEFIAQAPIVFVICALPEKSGARYGRRGRELYIFQDTAAAIQNLLLTATELGYGSCWVGAFDEQEVSKVLSLPQEKRAIAIIPVGKSAENPAPPKRLEVNELFTNLE
jgi:nitroreductase